MYFFVCYIQFFTARLHLFFIIFVIKNLLSTHAQHSRIISYYHHHQLIQKCSLHPNQLSYTLCIPSHHHHNFIILHQNIIYSLFFKIISLLVSIQKTVFFHVTFFIHTSSKQRVIIIVASKNSIKLLSSHLCHIISILFIMCIFIKMWILEISMQCTFLLGRYINTWMFIIIINVKHNFSF